MRIYRTPVELLAAYERGERDFRYWQLAGADLRGAILRKVVLHGADLRGVDLRDAQLKGADLSDAALGEANLRSADLRGADLSGAHLVDANLREANLADANLRGANVGGADFDGADVTGADLSDTGWETILPPGAIVLEEVAPEATISAEEEQPPIAWAETPAAWPEEEMRPEEGEWLLPKEDEEQAAVEEWTAGMVRLRPEVERPEREEPPLGFETQPPLKEPEEAEEESRYGI